MRNWYLSAVVASIVSALTLSAHHALAASLGVSATATSVAGTDTESDTQSKLVSATASAPSASSCLPFGSACTGRNVSLASASVSGNSLSLVANASQALPANFNPAQAIAIGSYTDVISFPQFMTQGSEISLMMGSYSLYVSNTISGNFQNPVTGLQLYESMSFTQANGSLFSAQVGSLVWNGTGFDLSSNATLAGSEFLSITNLPVSDLQGITFTVYAQLNTALDSTTFPNINFADATFADPISFAVYDSNGNIVPDLVVQSELGSQYSVLDGFTPSQTPLPAALPLFATGLGAMGLLGWRRKRKDAAALTA